MDDRQIINTAHKYKTPLYLFDGDRLEETYFNMKKVLPEAFEFFYSVKANPSYGICRILQKCSSGIEVASAGELHLALESGFDNKKILFTGPGKTYSELEFAVDSKILAINAESYKEIMLIDDIAKAKNKIVDVGLRIHPNFKIESKNPAISMMGTGTQFGVDIDEIPEILKYIKSSKNLNLVCFHVYAGSQIFQPDTTLAYFEQTINIFKELIEENDLHIKVLDFGGGFGVSYDGKNKPYDFEYFGAEINKLYHKYEDFFQGKKLVFESGRLLLAESGVFLTEVQYRKVLHDKVFLITDGGMNHNSLSTFREKKIRGNFLMKILDNRNEEETVTVAGPLCTPEDILGRNVTLNKADRGDILCIKNTGAYGSSFSPLGFLGHPAPCEVLVYKNNEYYLKKHGEFKNILNGQEIIEL